MPDFGECVAMTTGITFWSHCLKLRISLKWKFFWRDQSGFIFLSHSPKNIKKKSSHTYSWGGFFPARHWPRRGARGNFFRPIVLNPVFGCCLVRANDALAVVSCVASQRPLSEQLLQPSLVVTDFGKMETPSAIHLTYRAVHVYRAIHPDVW